MTERQLRVVHVVQRLRGGGAETQIRGLVQGLAARGVDVRVVSTYDDELSAEDRAALGVPVTSLQRRGRLDIATFYPRLTGAIRKARPDVVHGHLHAGKYAGRIAAIAARAPHIVFTEHGDGWKHPVRDAANAVLDRFTERFIVFSENARARFAEEKHMSLDRIVAIPNGVGIPPEIDRAAKRREFGFGAGAFALYLPARMTAQKNQELALRAFAEAAEPHWRFVFAGEGEDAATIGELASALGIADRVRLLGYRDDAAALCRAMDLFVMTSHWEKMPMALGEAMLAGLAPLTTPWLGYDDFVTDGDTGFVSADASVGAVAAAMRRAADPAVRAAVAARAEASARERFDLATTVSRHLDLYRTLAIPA